MKIASPPSTRGSQGHFKHQHPENRWEERPYYFCLNSPGQNLCDLNYNCKAGKKYNLWYLDCMHLTSFLMQDLNAGVEDVRILLVGGDRKQNIKPA